MPSGGTDGLGAAAAGGAGEPGVAAGGGLEVGGLEVGGLGVDGLDVGGLDVAGFGVAAGGALGVAAGGGVWADEGNASMSATAETAAAMQRAGRRNIILSLLRDTAPPAGAAAESLCRRFSNAEAACKLLAYATPLLI